MKQWLRKLLRLPLSFLLCTALYPALLWAKPTIDVSLQASFATPPFLLELLETAAAENDAAFPHLLDFIASDHFTNATHTDKQLHARFQTALRDSLDLRQLASWNFALGIRATAPRIEAQYQFWRTIVEHEFQRHDLENNGLVAYSLGRICPDARCDVSKEDYLPQSISHSERDLQYDRLCGDASRNPLYTVYIDPISNDFPKAWQEWQRYHKHEKYKVRYMASKGALSSPLIVNGYGTELALKRTDYIVLDDRETANIKTSSDFKDSTEIDLTEEDSSDLKPLSSSELRSLGINAASFIAASDHPLDTLEKVSQDFPKHAAALAQNNASQEFLGEHRRNRDLYLPPGYNMLWMNGQLVGPRDVDAFAMLDMIRRESSLVKSIQSLGLSATDAIQLLNHPKVTESQTNGDPQRYDFRDEIEGGDVIIWLNDIEKDKRYADWSPDIQAFLQMMFPGQLPAVRKETHNIIYIVDTCDRKDVMGVVENLLAFVKRRVPLRIGIVPISSSEATSDHARFLYHLTDTYGLTSAIDYLQKTVDEAQQQSPSEKIFNQVKEDTKLRLGRDALGFSQVLKSPQLAGQVERSASYLRRLGIGDASTLIFVNGVPFPKNEVWLQSISQQVSMDLRVVQQGVFEDAISQSTWIPSIFLTKSSPHRNPLIIPEDEKNINLFDVAQLYKNHDNIFSNMKPFRASGEAEASTNLAFLVVTNLNSEEGAQLVLNATEFAERHTDIEIKFLHQAAAHAPEEQLYLTPEWMSRIQDVLEKERPGFSAEHKEAVGRYLTGALMSQSITVDTGGKTSHNPLVKSLRLQPGDSGVLVNGRLVGPLPKAFSLSKEDFEALLAYERRKRVDPVVNAVQDLEISKKLRDPLAMTKLSSILALSFVSDVPEGIFDTTPGPRSSVFTGWSSLYTCIESGEKDDAVIQLVASVDPASETGQRWIPILKTLSELDGIFLQIFLNPKQKLEELPVKRFYRYALEAGPQFNEDGSLKEVGAHFAGIPEDALLTMTLDVPPSWLVAPAKSIQDLDNIKLSSLKGQVDIEAVYELENILIEGHSRDTTIGNPPRGAQLVLGIENHHQAMGTIIMANLGYFQFKANPGVYRLELEGGVSQQIFNLDSAGTKGYAEQPGDENTEISLMSFKGATIFPRLSRKPGRELDDVLEASSSIVEDLTQKGAEIADEILSKVGLSNVNTGDYIAKGIELGQKVFSRADKRAVEASRPQHADINIFSVASGHLYERMLNIMILSVMRHTNHTVKFWFIEQFLSPSFKSFLPTMAEEYGFAYEMVTYKWPHWLRAQTEKQRTIWGYKILFLDVLFPLDLEKVIFVDADQIVRTDMYDLVQHDLQGAPYGFTPMCDSRTEMEGFRFWKQGYWANFLRGRPYHISALYVVDLKRFRAIAAGDRLRQQYHTLSADPESLSNLDQDLPNHMQAMLPIHSLPQEWLWCETWCSDEALTQARTIDLCNNPQTKEPKLDRARRQVPEWTVYDDEVAALAKRRQESAPIGVMNTSKEEEEHTNEDATVPEEEVEARRKDEL